MAIHRRESREHGEYTGLQITGQTMTTRGQVRQYDKGAGFRTLSHVLSIITCKRALSLNHLKLVSTPLNRMAWYFCVCVDRNLQILKPNRSKAEANVFEHTGDSRRLYYIERGISSLL
jgi:hypothetical protein